MNCGWKELLTVLPPGLRGQVDKLGRQTMEELRLRLGQPPELKSSGGSQWLQEPVTQGDLDYVIHAASRYSPWASATMGQGYLTAPGGHRIGLCGEAVCQNGTMTGLRQVWSMCIRVARDFPGIGAGLDKTSGSVLILGAPGWGKTTLLRDLIRRKSQHSTVAVVDERKELFPENFPRDGSMDVLSGCPKTQGVELVLRTMSPKYIALDEITGEEDCQALVRAVNCGVDFLATAHASSIRDLKSRKGYAPLLEQGAFHWIVILRQDKSYELERMAL